MTAAHEWHADDTQTERWQTDHATDKCVQAKSSALQEAISPKMLLGLHTLLLLLLLMMMMMTTKHV